MKNNNPKGILYILVGMAIFSIQDALIKFVYEDCALYELYFGRTLTAAILLISYLIFSKQKIILKAHYPYLAILRVSCFFFGFSFHVGLPSVRPYLPVKTGKRFSRNALTASV